MAIWDRGGIAEELLQLLAGDEPTSANRTAVGL
jgi:hypothetical protein